MATAWGEWSRSDPWLLEVIEIAEQEARERGQSKVRPEHLAAALTRSGAAESLLEELHVDPRRWRDRVIYTLGVNNGIHFQLEGEAIRRLPHVGAVTVDVSSLLVLELARSEAMASGTELTPAHLVVAFVDGERYDIATGTAKSQGITLAKARRAAGIAHHRRVIADGITPPPNRARKIGPLVLLGGGDTSPEVFRYAIGLAQARRGPARRPVSVACVFAAGPVSDQARERRLGHFRSHGDVVATDCKLDNRGDASSPAVLAALAEADVIFMDGGKAERLYDTLVGTEAIEAITDASDAGAVVMGLSAGAAIWGVGCMSDWASGDDPEPFPLLNWLEDIVVLPHYVPDAEGSLRRLIVDLSASAGVGVAHGGAVVVQHGWEQWRTISPGVARCIQVEQLDAPAEELPGLNG
jgi:hypothetical protein